MQYETVSNRGYSAALGRRSRAYHTDLDWLFLGNAARRWFLMTGVLVKDVTLGYGMFPAVNDLSVQFADGSLTAIVGPNGAGKSTLLKGIGGELKPISGFIDRGSTKDCDLAYLPQQSEIDRSFPISVRDFVAMGLWHQVGAFGRIGRKFNTRINEAIEAVGLRGLEDRQISALSGGQMQRVLFARVLLQDAPLVLLDEPFTAIDTKTTADLLQIVMNWHGQGRTVLAVLHDNDLVRTHFPNTLMIARDLVGHGKTEDILTASNLLRARQMCEACDHPPHSCEHKFPPAA